MKKTILLLTIVLTFLLTGCMETRYITEKYIKTNIENHKEGDFSTIKAFSIFKGISFEGTGYIELTGCKYTSNKTLVIGADKYYMMRQRFKGDQTIVADITYIDLSLTQCKSILDNYRILQDKIESEKTMMNEEIYHDFTVSKDLFISCRTSIGGSPSYIDFWIQGEKYSIPTAKIMKKLDKFMNY